MSRYDLQFRVTERNSICRCCDKVITAKVEKVVAFYTSTGQGSYIFLCTKCVKTLGELINE